MRMTAIETMPQTISMTKENIHTGIQPNEKTNVRANAVHNPPPMIGSWINCL